MSEMKSAWEIAQEKANKLGKLSDEEKEQQERQRYRQLGQTLVQKWLDDPRLVDLAAELNRYGEKEREIIKQAIIEHLAEAISFTDTWNINNVKRAIEAISSLEPELQPKAEEIRQLVQEYEEAEHKMRRELESSYWKTLHQLRISGTAIDAINIEADPEWQPVHQRLIEEFMPRLNDLKQAIIQD